MSTSRARAGVAVLAFLTAFGCSPRAPYTASHRPKSADPSFAPPRVNIPRRTEKTVPARYAWPASLAAPTSAACTLEGRSESYSAALRLRAEDQPFLKLSLGSPNLRASIPAGNPVTSVFVELEVLDAAMVRGWITPSELEVFATFPLQSPPLTLRGAASSGELTVEDPQAIDRPPRPPILLSRPCAFFALASTVTRPVPRVSGWTTFLSKDWREMICDADVPIVARSPQTRLPAPSSESRVVGFVKGERRVFVGPAVDDLAPIGIFIENAHRSRNDEGGWIVSGRCALCIEERAPVGLPIELVRESCREMDP